MLFRDEVQEADSTRASELMRLRDSLGLISLGTINYSIQNSIVFVYRFVKYFVLHIQNTSIKCYRMPYIKKKKKK
jgi:hypothetical protein